MEISMDLCPRLSSHPLILPPLSNRGFLTPNRQHCGSDPPAECRGSMLSGTRRWNTGRLGMLGNPSEVREVRQLGGFNPKKDTNRGWIRLDPLTLRSAVSSMQLRESGLSKQRYCWYRCGPPPDA